MPNRESTKELERLEAEIAMLLADPSLPIDKRLNLERRLNEIREKASQIKPQ